MTQLTITQADIDNAVAIDRAARRTCCSQAEGDSLRKLIALGRAHLAGRVIVFEPRAGHFDADDSGAMEHQVEADAAAEVA